MNLNVMLLAAVLVASIGVAMAGYSLTTCDGDQSMDDCEQCCIDNFGSSAYVDHLAFLESCGCGY